MIYLPVIKKAMTNMAIDSLWNADLRSLLGVGADLLGLPS